MGLVDGYCCQVTIRLTVCVSVFRQMKFSLAVYSESPAILYLLDSSDGEREKRRMRRVLWCWVQSVWCHWPLVVISGRWSGCRREIPRLHTRSSDDLYSERRAESRSGCPDAPPSWQTHGTDLSLNNYVTFCISWGLLFWGDYYILFAITRIFILTNLSKFRRLYEFLVNMNILF